jgi:hypothetical protein
MDPGSKRNYLVILFANCRKGGHKGAVHAPSTQKYRLHMYLIHEKIHLYSLFCETRTQREC